MRVFKIAIVAALVFSLACLSPAWASNMGFKLVKKDQSESSGGFTLEEVDKDTEQILEKDALVLERVIDLLGKSSGIMEDANPGRQKNFADQLGRLVDEWSALSARTPAGHYYSEHIFNFGPESQQPGSAQIVRDDFSGLLMADVNYDGGTTRIVVKKEASGYSKVGFGEIGPTTRAITYTFNPNSRIISYIWDAAEFDSLTSGKLIFIPIFS